MKTITLKELACYLPFEVETIDFSSVNMGLNKPLKGKLTNTNIMNFIELDTNSKLCFYPLLMLTQEIEHKGERFVPIVDLLQMKFPKKWESISHYDEIEVDKEGYPRAYFKYKANLEIMINTFAIDETPNWIIQKLLEWHFWIFDQSYFEEGLVIDKSKIK